MNLKPHEILNKLGFNVPEEGISFNSNDLYLFDIALTLIGKSIKIDLESLTDEELKDNFMSLWVFARTPEQAKEHINIVKNKTDMNVERQTLEVILEILKKGK